MEWCKKVGIKTPKLEYPAFFDGGLLGVRAKEPIRHREVILSIPYNVLMTMDMAKEHPVLCKVFEGNKMFSEDNPDHEQLILTVFLLYEW